MKKELNAVTAQTQAVVKQSMNELAQTIVKNVDNYNELSPKFQEMRTKAMEVLTNDETIKFMQTAELMKLVELANKFDTDMLDKNIKLMQTMVALQERVETNEAKEALAQAVELINEVSEDNIQVRKAKAININDIE